MTGSADLARVHVLAHFVVEKDWLRLIIFTVCWSVIVTMVKQLECKIGNRVEEQELERKHGIKEQMVFHVVWVISREVNPAVEVEQD